jgi:predicted secreted Zn-dependent protease
MVKEFKSVTNLENIENCTSLQVKDAKISKDILKPPDQNKKHICSLDLDRLETEERDILTGRTKSQNTSIIRR